VEGIITAFSDEFPRIIGKHRKLTLLVYLTCIMILSLPTVTYGGIYVITFLETYATGAAMMFVVLMECVTIAWFYGKIEKKLFKVINDIVKKILSHSAKPVRLIQKQQYKVRDSREHKFDLIGIKKKQIK